MRTRIITIIPLLICLLLIDSCRRNPYKINTSSISANIEIRRLEKDLFSLDPGKIQESVPLLRDKYGTFLQLFSYVINAGDVKDSSFSDLLAKFCTDKLNYEVYQSVINKYPDTKEIEIELKEAFRHYLYYFPGKIYRLFIHVSPVSITA